MPLPKSSSNHRSSNQAFAFNDVIAENNAAMLDDMTPQELHDLDEALDQAMEENGELCSILDLIRGHRKPKKLRKVKDLKPIAFVRFATRGKGKPKPITLKALLDSGGSGTLVNKKYVTKLARILGADPQKWETPGGTMHTSEKVKARFTLPEFHDNHLLEFDVHVAENLGAYDMIIGRDVLRDLGINIKFSDMTVEWDNSTIPFKDIDDVPRAYYIQDSYAVDQATSRLKHILDAKYEAADLGQVAEECTHLSIEERLKIRSLLLKYAELFDGTLGVWKGEECDFELKEGVKPYHAKAFPIPKIHVNTLRKEVERLCRIGVLKKVNRSEWATPTFIIPKKDGMVRFISDFRELNKRL